MEASPVVALKWSAETACEDSVRFNRTQPHTAQSRRGITSVVTTARLTRLYSRSLDSTHEMKLKKTKGVHSSSCSLHTTYVLRLSDEMQISGPRLRRRAARAAHTRTAPPSANGPTRAPTLLEHFVHDFVLRGLRTEASRSARQPALRREGGWSAARRWRWQPSCGRTTRASCM
jgi:hypothetical protein